MPCSNIGKRPGWSLRIQRLISDFLKSTGDSAGSKRHPRKRSCLKSYRKQSLRPRPRHPAKVTKFMLPLSKGWLCSFASLCCISAVLLLFNASGLSASSPELFTDITQQAGIQWQQFSGESPDRFLIETMGGGVAFLDFDNDGLLDIFFVNGGETPGGKSPGPIKNALYRNLGNGKFENVASKAGVDHIDFYGMGVAVGDFDNDGFPDLYVTGFPTSALLDRKSTRLNSSH